MMNGGGAPTSSSSVPCHRCHWITPPDPKRVDDHMPISPAPSATYSCVPWRAPDSTMKNAIEAKMIGCSTEMSTKKIEYVRFLTLNIQLTAKRRT
jgi:hypothetical protein